MAGLNKVMIIGNLGRDPEMRYTANGNAMTTFTVAVNRFSRAPEGGESREETEWFRVVCWERTAEIANQYLQKGRQVYIEGRLQTRQWQDQQGQTRYTTEVVASNLILLGSRGEGGGMEADVPGQTVPDTSDLDNMPF